MVEAGIVAPNRQPNFCVDCGIEISQWGTRCRSCALKGRMVGTRRPQGHCADCEREISRGAIRCNSCAAQVRALVRENPMYGRRHTAESRKKMSEACHGRVSPMLGKHHSAETRARISAALSGESNSLRGRKHTPEALAKMRVAQKGRRKSDEHRARLSVAARERFEDPAERARVGLASNGRKHDLKSQAKMRVAASAFWGSKEGNELKLLKRRAWTGKGNPNWKDGSTPGYQNIRGSAQYADWRLAVLRRDGFICRICGDCRGKYLQAHHIFSFADHSELRFEVSNGVTLCGECHRKHSDRVEQLVLT